MHEDTTLEFGLCQPSLVLRREVCAELHIWVLPLGRVFGDLFLEHRHGFGVGHAGERLGHELVQTLDEIFIFELEREKEITIMNSVEKVFLTHKLVEELDIGRAGLQNI